MLAAPQSKNELQLNMLYVKSGQRNVLEGQGGLHKHFTSQSRIQVVKNDEEASSQKG